MLHGSTGRGSAPAPVSEPPTPVALAPANRIPRPRRARRSMRPLPATSGVRDANLSSLLVIGFSFESVCDRLNIFNGRISGYQAIMFGLAFHQLVWNLSYRGEREAAPVYRALQYLHGLHLMLSVGERRPKSMMSL